jgi:ribokinase
MTSSECEKELLQFLEEKFREINIVVLPDFFLDRFINLEWDATEFSALVEEVTKRNGGSLDGISQTDMRGGNAINVASALASLGAKVTPIVCTSEFGLQQIKYHFKNNPVDTTHIKLLGKASVTTALEFKNRSKKTNVMLRDLGALTNFGPSNLNESDYKLIEDADYVCLFNWAGTFKFGTALAQVVFERAKRKCKTKTYYDTADPTPRAKEIPVLMKRVLKTNKVDILSLNENEAITYASFFDDDLKKNKGHVGFSEIAMEAARILAKRLTARIDLHTQIFSATLRTKEEVVVPSFKVKMLRATGAGDAWCAGNILADYNGLSDECRLMLANATAASYLSDAKGLHSTKEKLADFLRTQIG